MRQAPLRISDLRRVRVGLLCFEMKLTVEPHSNELLVLVGALSDPDLET
jgi:hypothetical protein